jgi:hypothetical protein
VEASVAKPGLIDAPGKTGPWMNIVQTIGRSFIGLPKIDVREISATLLDQAVNGLDKETLSNEDMIGIGQKILAAQEQETW